MSQPRTNSRRSTQESSGHGPRASSPPRRPTTPSPRWCRKQSAQKKKERKRLLARHGRRLAAACLAYVSRYQNRGKSQLNRAADLGVMSGTQRHNIPLVIESPRLLDVSAHGRPSQASQLCAEARQGLPAAVQPVLKPVAARADCLRFGVDVPDPHGLPPWEAAACGPSASMFVSLHCRVKMNNPAADKL